MEIVLKIMGRVRSMEGESTDMRRVQDSALGNSRKGCLEREPS